MQTNISELKDRIDTKTLHLVLLSLVTYGVYTILWLYKNYRVIDKVTKIKSSDDKYILWIAICFGLGVWAYDIQGMFSNVEFFYSKFYETISVIISFVPEVLYILWAFKAKNALQEYALNEYKMDFKMNPFYLVIFNVFYINYCINDLPEEKRKQQIINGEN